MPSLRGIEAKGPEISAVSVAKTRRGRYRRRVTATLASGLLCFAACATTPAPCRSPDDCASGNECLANRCLSQGAEPVPLGSARLVVEPTLSAVVRPGGMQASLPSTVTFGGPPATNQQLLLKFPGWGGLEVQAAFLLLQPAVDAEPSGSDVKVSVSLAAGPWPAGVIDEPPSSGPPSSMGIARTRPPAPLRIDVTAQLLALENQPDHGLIIRAEGDVARGATYLTGADGAPPRLDVYGRPSPSGRRPAETRRRSSDL